MKRKLINLILLTAIIVLSIGPNASQSFAQSSSVKLGKTGQAIDYHGGPVMQGASNIYVIGYGDWPEDGGSQTMPILLDFLIGLGSSQYFKINTQYYDSLGNRPSGAIFFGGHGYERTYSRGKDLQQADLEAIITDQIDAGHFPVDANGIYLIMGTPDVSSDSTGFCQPNTAPHHGAYSLYGTQMKYAFIGNPLQCPSIEAPQFVAPNGSMLPTPNGDLAADAMATLIAHTLNAIVTNPMFSAWYDRYGFENADKCAGKYGQTHLTPSGARANVRFGTREFLLQQNWVNTAIGYCALSPEDLSGNPQR